jgi:hypothetical protein
LQNNEVQMKRSQVKKVSYQGGLSKNDGQGVRIFHHRAQGEGSDEF